MENKSDQIKVYYNSACPVCRAGINSQKEKMQGCSVDWKDVHLTHQFAKELGTNLEFVRERLHVIDETGKLRVGFEAFITIWQHSPSENWKAKVSSFPIMRQLLNIFYNIFAFLLYRWNKLNKNW